MDDGQQSQDGQRRYAAKEVPVYSIVLVTYNGLPHTIRCLESLYRHPPASPWEVIIVDNASSDGTVAWLREFGKGDGVHGRTNMRIVKSDQNLHFAAANNLGAQVAAGAWLCLLNNDTIVTPGWLDDLRARLEAVPGCGIAGPMSSSSNGRQMASEAAAGYRIENTRTLDAFAAKYRKERLGQWSEAGVLYGWCLLMRTATWQALGGMDDRFLDSYDDNDLCLRAQLAGYKLVIAQDVFIHHQGQATLLAGGSLDDYARNGYENERRFQEKWNRPDQQLVAVMRLANCETTIQAVLDRTARFADAGILVHLCRSTDGTEAIVRAHPAVRQVWVYDGPFQEDYERNFLLQQALKLQAEGKADWCISVDGDELYEEKFDARVKAMMNPRNPHLMAWIANWRTIWNREIPEIEIPEVACFCDPIVYKIGTHHERCPYHESNVKEYYRADGIFGGFMNYRFFRLLPGQRITSAHPEGHHCGSAPVFPPENIGWTSLRVKHLGYDTTAQRARKHDFYVRRDHFKNPADIGNADYHHLIDTNVTLRRWRPHQGISANILCRGEWGWLRGLLRMLEPLVDEFVIVDSGSEDETLPELKRFAARSPVPMKVLQIEWPEHFARVRNLAKRHSTQPWILAMDPDENFDPNDVQILARLVEEPTEAYLFECINYLEPYFPASGKPAVYATTETVRLFRNLPELYWSGIVHETLEDALMARRYKGAPMTLRAPVRIHHRGYLKPPEAKARKFQAYERMCLRQAEVTRGMDPRPYFNLSMHYLNDGKDAEAEALMEKADGIGLPSWRIRAQLAGMRLRRARADMASALALIPGDHPVRPQFVELLAAIDKGPAQFVKV